MEIKRRESNENTFDKLEEIILDVRGDISQEEYKKLVFSMKDRLKEVIKQKGRYENYLL